MTAKSRSEGARRPALTFDEWLASSGDGLPWPANELGAKPCAGCGAAGYWGAILGLDGETRTIRCQCGAEAAATVPRSASAAEERVARDIYGGLLATCPLTRPIAKPGRRSRINDSLAS